MSKVQTQVMPTDAGSLSQDELRKRMEYNTNLLNEYGGDVRAIQLYGMGANDITRGDANASLQREAEMANLNPEQELLGTLYSAGGMSPQQLQQSYSKYYGKGPQASINYGKIDVPMALRARLANRMGQASSAGQGRLNRGLYDDYMKMQGMYQGLSDSKVRNEMGKAAQAQANYAAEVAKRNALTSSLFGLGGMVAGGAIGGPAGAAIGGGLGQTIPGLL